MSRLAIPAIIGFAFVVGAAARADEEQWRQLERQFRDVPVEARRLVAPLFWLHGDESQERLELLVAKMAEAHNGGFVAESRPHKDFLGPGWYRDLDICLAAAKRHGLQMWIFDEKWWPSQSIGGKVPEQYRARRLVADSVVLEGAQAYCGAGYGGGNLVAALAARQIEGGLDGASIIDLAPMIKDGVLRWNVPAGTWRLMRFTWTMAPRSSEGFTLDGASPDCVEWYIRTVYQPHYDRYKDDFGKVIAGFFYDEPEVRGDWGTAVLPILAERGIDWKKPLVAWKFQLAGEEHAAAKYAYTDAFLEAWGRTMYGGLGRWCEARGVKSIGHFIEHGKSYLRLGGTCPGNMFQLQKYSAMGGVDLVCHHLDVGKRWGPEGEIFQIPKLASTISHVYGKADDIAFCEIFGGYGQGLTYTEMKWLTDQHEVRGTNFMVPHSFNPRAPFDRDFPPYFYNGGFEPRFPLYRVWADYTSRLGLLLTGGRHVCPVAVLVCGNSIHVGKAATPDEIATSLQDVQLDNDWLPYDAFDAAKVEGRELRLFGERYRALVVPSIEVIPPATLEKVKSFFEAGGVVIACGALPSKSATLGRSSDEVRRLCEAIWGNGAGDAASIQPRKTSPAGGRSYAMAEKPAPEDFRKALTGDAGVHPTLEVVDGKTDNWVHVLHRVKADRDVLFVCNQNHAGEARRLRFRATAAGEPQCWDAMQGQVLALPFERVGPNQVEFELTMEPSSSALVVFAPKAPPLLAMVDAKSRTVHPEIAVVRRPWSGVVTPSAPPLPKEKPAEESLRLDGGKWVWFPEGEPQKDAPAGTRCFRCELTLPQDRKVKTARFMLAADNSFVFTINGKKASEGKSWRDPVTVDLAPHLAAGANVLAIAATNDPGVPSQNPAGLTGAWRIEFETGPAMEGRINRTWKCAKESQAGWTDRGFDDKGWAAAKELVKYGDGPWAVGATANLTISPITADPFAGRLDLPADIDLSRCRAFLEMDDLPGSAASVTVNDTCAGGVIGRPWRVEITPLLKAGANSIEIVPLAPKGARVVFRER